VVAGVVVMNTTEPYTFTTGGNEGLYRVLVLKPETYTFSGDWDGGEELTVRIYSRTQNQAILETQTELYRGTLSEASFTVPEDAAQVYFYFQGAEGDTLRSVVLSDGTAIPLDYKFLPEMIEFRLQGSLRLSSSFLLRAQFMKDAWTIFKQSPLIGYGLSSTENLYASVQPFEYGSLYVHNHLLQVMTDMGLVGLAAFLMLLVGTLWLLLRRLRQEKDALAAMLLACWVMMNSHSLMEINFSLRPYQCAALFLLVLPVVLYAEPLTKKAVKLGSAVVCGCVWIFLAVFGGLLANHRTVQQKYAMAASYTAERYMETMQECADRDVLDPVSYQLEYVANAVNLGQEQYLTQMESYVKKLEYNGSYEALSGLLQYYYLPTGQYETMFSCSRACVAQRASQTDAWNLFAEFYRDQALPVMGAGKIDVFVDGVLAFRDYLTAYNSQGRLEEITLSGENQAFLDAVSSARDSGLTGDDLYTYLTQALG
jgi:hypothetical protein